MPHFPASRSAGACGGHKDRSRRIPNQDSRRRIAAFNTDVKAVLESFGLREGANREPREYVVEKAFVGDGI
jgi:hypothetical protein